MFNGAASWNDGPSSGCGRRRHHRDDDQPCRRAQQIGTVRSTPLGYQVRACASNDQMNLVQGQGPAPAVTVIRPRLGVVPGRGQGLSDFAAMTNLGGTEGGLRPPGHRSDVDIELCMRNSIQSCEVLQMMTPRRNCQGGQIRYPVAWSLLTESAHATRGTEAEAKTHTFVSASSES